MNKARPIDFSPRMAPLVLDGTKTQTRRLVNPPPEISGERGDYARVRYGGECYGGPTDYMLDEILPRFGCPFGKVGGDLYVRENHRIVSYNPAAILGPHVSVQYPDGTIRQSYLTSAEARKLNARKTFDRQQPGRFMFRSLSRASLRITAIRVQRLQHISDDDALAEGARWGRHRDGLYWPGAGNVLVSDNGPGPAGEQHRGHRAEFGSIWDGLHGYGAWKRNPWVWALTFEVVK